MFGILPVCNVEESPLYFTIIGGQCGGKHCASAPGGRLECCGKEVVNHSPPCAPVRG